MIIIEVSGGLGNQMFGYAFARALSVKNADEKLYISKRLLKNDCLRKYGLDHFVLSNCIETLEKHAFLNLLHSARYNFSKLCNVAKIKIQKKHTITVHDTLSKRNYAEIPYSKGKINIYRGLFQSSKYFDEIRDVLVNDFKMLDPLDEWERDIERDILDSESVCLHVRRGDYINSPLHYVCTLEYYKKAVDYIIKNKVNPKFFVFSDDIEWVKSELNINNAVYVDKSRNEFSDFHLMKNCKNFIISNSTFSWWAQYLSTFEDKVVVAPNVWLSDEKPFENSLYQESWTCIDPY